MPPVTPPIRFAIIGTGWRTEFFLRVARALPERFVISGVVARRPESRQAMRESWGIDAYETLDALLAAQSPEFVVVAVPREVAPELIGQVAARALPVLTETPPGIDEQAMLPLIELVRGGAKIQVAEQYHLQPLLKTQIDLARFGLLGDITQAQVSNCHDYHGVSLIRRMLGIRFENATVSAHEFRSPLTVSPDRNGDPRQDGLIEATQLIARFDFGDRLGIADFTDEQYYSWILTGRILIRGTRGEIADDRVTYLQDFRTPISYPIERVNTGQNSNLEGYHLAGLRAGDRWVYRNDYAPARLEDDEIAIATVLSKMGDYARGGDEFYSLAEGAQDHYLALVAQRAATTGETIITTTQAWAD